jgi:hypothetical protein
MGTKEPQYPCELLSFKAYFVIKKTLDLQIESH